MERLSVSLGLQVLVAICTVSLPLSLHGQDFPFNDYTLPWDERVDDLVSRLTVDEITLQMANGGRTTNAPAIPRLGIKPYGWGAECLHGAGQSGNATSFPQALGMAAIFRYCTCLFRTLLLLTNVIK